MKINISIFHGILEIGKEPLFHWKQYLEFIVESFVRSVSELKYLHDLMQKVIENLFEHLKVLHTESYVYDNG